MAEREIPIGQQVKILTDALATQKGINEKQAVRIQELTEALSRPRANIASAVPNGKIQCAERIPGKAAREILISHSRLAWETGSDLECLASEIPNLSERAERAFIRLIHNQR